MNGGGGPSVASLGTVDAVDVEARRRWREFGDEVGRVCALHPRDRAAAVPEMERRVRQLGRDYREYLVQHQHELGPEWRDEICKAKEVLDQSTDRR